MAIQIHLLRRFFGCATDAPTDAPTGDGACEESRGGCHAGACDTGLVNGGTDRKSTRLNSSHRCISYAVFCLKKKKDPNQQTFQTCPPSSTADPGYCGIR